MYKVKFELPVCISVSPVHSLDTWNLPYKRNLVEAGEIISWRTAWPSDSLLVSSSSVRRPQSFRVIIKGPFNIYRETEPVYQHTVNHFFLLPQQGIETSCSLLYRTITFD